MKEQKMYRQGDLLIIPSNIPSNAIVQPRVHGQIVLVEGEATGHLHAIATADVELLAVSEQVDRWLRVCSAEATLTHPEHGTVTLPRDSYIVRRQREYTPEGIRYVAD